MNGMHNSRNLIGLKIFSCFLMLSVSLQATSIDGTVSPQWVTTPASFSNGDSAIGFVALNAGFSIDAGASVTFNIPIPVAGAIDLNGTGNMILDGDLLLASNATLVSSGIITPTTGKALFLGGNLTIPAGAVLTAGAHTIIDGQGHELILGTPGGSLFIDGPAGTTLTLRNMTLRGVRNNGGTPAIRFGASPNQKLILENVTMCLADNFTFNGGRLDISGDVKLKGPYSFTYASSYDATVRADATFFIDMDVFFSYSPTDKLHTHLKLQTITSTLYLNGCTVFTPNTTGLKLIDGHLVVDHKTVLQSTGVGQERMAFTFGDYVFNNNLLIDILPGAQFEFDNALVVYANKN